MFDLFYFLPKEKKAEVDGMGYVVGNIENHS